MGKISDGIKARRNLVDTSWSFRNKLINGAMEFDQRFAGAVATPLADSNRHYLVDRWCVQNDATGLTAQRVSDAPPGHFSSLKLTITSPIASGQCFLAQYIEAHSYLDVLWGTADAKPLTASFWVKASVAGTYTVGLEHSDGSRIYPTAFTVATPGEWEEHIVTFPGEPTGTWGTTASLMLYFDLGSANTSTPDTWGTTDNKRATGADRLALTNGATFQLGGAQLESGLSATPFERRPQGLEQMLCQRYFEKSYDLEVAPGTASEVGKKFAHSINATTFYEYAGVRFAVSKRAFPTVSTHSPVTGVRDVIHSYTATADGFYGALNSVGQTGFHFIGAGMTANHLYGFQWVADAEI